MSLTYLENYAALRDGFEPIPSRPEVFSSDPKALVASKRREHKKRLRILSRWRDYHECDGRAVFLNCFGHYRRYKAISTREIADRLGVSTSKVRRYDRKMLLSEGELCACATAYGCKPVFRYYDATPEHAPLTITLAALTHLSALDLTELSEVAQ